MVMATANTPAMFGTALARNERGECAAAGLRRRKDGAVATGRPVQPLNPVTDAVGCLSVTRQSLRRPWDQRTLVQTMWVTAM